MKYPFLDGFKGVAILMIVAHHMCVGFDLYNVFDGDAPFLTWVLFKSWNLFHIDLSPLYLEMESIVYRFKGILGVQIFLIISGFLITRSLTKKDLQWKSITRFYVRRFLRIYPAYFLLVVVSLWLFASQIKQPLQDTLTTGAHYLLFLQNYFPRNMYLEHAWTLAIFEQFYFACPLVILAATRLFPSLIARRRFLIAACLVAMAIGSFARFSYLIIGKPLLSWPLNSSVPYFTILYHLGSLAFGCLLALLEPRALAWKKDKRLGYVLWVVGVVLCYILIFKIDWGYHWGPWYLNVVGYLATGALLLAAYQGVSVFTRLRWLQWVGQKSYGIYLWHILILAMLGKWLGILPLTMLVPAYLICVIAAGALSSQTIERYFLELRERLVPK